MSIIALLIYIVLIGVICWFVTTYIPMAEPFPRIVIGVGILMVILLVLYAFGLLGHIDQPVPRIR